MENIITSSWHGYPKVYAVGHNAVSNIFDDVVLIEEKIDGSQFSFGRFGDELKMKSKGAIVYPESPGMFKLAVESVKSRFHILKDGWTYRGEYLVKPKHNTLCYDRVPIDNIILFDINTGEETYMSYREKKYEANRLGYEVVPNLEYCMVKEPSFLLSFLDRKSILGGVSIEGVVVKNYNKYTSDGKAMFAKYVSEKFKEKHRNSWGISNPKSNDIVEIISTALRTDARWRKAIYRLRDDRQLENDPKDIGKLLKAVQDDIEEECSEEIKENLYKWAIKNILRKTVYGFPEFYKKYLLESSFENRE